MLPSSAKPCHCAPAIRQFPTIALLQAHRGSTVVTVDRGDQVGSSLERSVRWFAFGGVLALVPPRSNRNSREKNLRDATGSRGVRRLSVSRSVIIFAKDDRCVLWSLSRSRPVDDGTCGVKLSLPGQPGALCREGNSSKY
jgi:hypothetical protein